MVTTIADLALAHPNQSGLTDAHGSFSWAQLNAAANRLAYGLTRLVTGPERRIAVYAHNSSEVLLLHVAAINAGVSVVPVAYHLTSAELAHILRDAQCEAVFADADTATEALAAAGELPVFVWRGEAGHGIDFESWMGGFQDREPDPDVQSLAHVLYTSGTTGQPKRVETPPSLFKGGSVREFALSLTQHYYFMQQGVHLAAGPLYHAGSLIAAWVLAAGKPVVVLDRFTSIGFLEAVDRYSVSSSLLVPTHFVTLLELDPQVRAQYDVSSLELIVHTGSFCPLDVKRAMIEWFGPVLFESYGGTEAGTICRISSAEWLEHPGSVGKVQPPYARALVLDEDGNELRAGQTGRLYFEDPTGRGVVYPGDAAKTASAHARPGVFTMGEIGHVDNNGYVYITDRFSDMIISGGVNIYPAEVELVLLRHPLVRDVAVVGIDDPVMGETAHALVVPERLEQPIDPKDLKDFCREQISSVKCPKVFHVVDDLHRSPLGKINKKHLARSLQDTLRKERHISDVR